jgi:alginate O-acetyltransferase complex protein AlgI
MGSVADAVFALPEASLTTSWAWLGIVAYAYQIYFDFSGYSDMAIGLGAMFGLRFKENFNRPYVSQTVTEFWRRWHISLTTVFREYLYFPLGGSRRSTVITYRNLLLVFLLSGLWHGAAWTFILWGIFHGLFLIIDRLFWLRVSRAIPAPMNMLITFTIILFGWVLFRAESLPEALHFMGILLGETPSPYLPTPAGFIVDNRSFVVFLVATGLSFTPQFLPQARTQLLELRTELSTRRTLAYGGVSVVTLLLATMFLAARGHTPFLYFKF